MKAAFDGMRKNLARSFNELIMEYNYQIELENHKIELSEKLYNLRQFVGYMLCVYNDNIEGDFNDLSEINLYEPKDSSNN